MVNEMGTMELEKEESMDNPENLVVESMEESSLVESTEHLSKSEAVEQQTQKSLMEESKEKEEIKPTAKSKDPVPAHKVEELKKELEAQENIDLKLQVVIDFMEEALCQSGTPQFKNFWEARRICIELFKENISPGVRAHMWSKYGELTKQARALKEILDEQSSFAVEQIEIAITALEEEVKKERTFGRDSSLDISKLPVALKQKFDGYAALQNELNVLNAAASRINSLRKELIKTEMRIKQKNRFFQRLSSIGDAVFPRRKELIKQVSQNFQGDVESFVSEYFGEDEVGESLFVLREEIKKLQSFAKQLTLNTQSFTSTRLRLSTCWDKIKGKEKEWKKTRAEKKVTFQENAAPILEKISTLDKEFEGNNLTNEEVSHQIDDISNEMRRVELGRDEVKELKDALGKVRKDLQAKRKVEDEARQAKRNELERQRQQLFYDLKEELQTLLDKAEEFETDNYIAECDVLKEKARGMKLNKAQRMELDPLYRSMNDLLTEKREAFLLNLPEGDRDAIKNCNEVLQQRVERRREIKAQLELLRKAAGSSGLDFEQAMNYNQQIEDERARLDKATQAIEEIEQKLSDLKSTNG